MVEGYGSLGITVVAVSPAYPLRLKDIPLGHIEAITVKEHLRCHCYLPSDLDYARLVTITGYTVWSSSAFACCILLKAAADEVNS